MNYLPFTRTSARCSFFVAIISTAACDPCLGKTGAELDKCKAKDAATSGPVTGLAGRGADAGGKAGSKVSKDGPAECESLETLESKSVAKSGTLSSPTSSDCYRFKLDEVGSVRFTVSSYDKVPVVALIRDDGDGIFQPKETVIDSHLGSIQTYDTFTIPLPKGEYYVKVDGANTKYTLNVKYDRHVEPSPSDDPGSAPSQASSFPIELGDKSVAWGGYVGALDPDDYYRFELDEVGNVRFTLTAYEKVPVVTLVRDDGDGIFQPGDAVIDNHLGSIQTYDTFAIPLEKGEYYVRVNGGDTTYTLNSKYEAHQTPSPALDPGASPTQESSVLLELDDGPVALGGYVGRVDPTDFYRFHVGDNQTVRFTVSDYEAVPVMTLIHDDGDGIFQSTDALLDNHLGSIQTYDTFTSKPLSMGEYYLRVSTATDTTYTLHVESVKMTMAR